MIPKIIHQTWKTAEIPAQWKYFAEIVQKMNPDWEYKLWTDNDNDKFVKENFPDFYDIFIGFSRNIMRADVIRYLIMHKYGGVYLDLDYEVLKPFDFGNHKLILPMNRSKAFGDEHDALGNCIFASVPNHKFWDDVINDLKNNPPKIDNYGEVIDATGPGLLTRIYYQNNYDDVYLPEKMIYHPPTPTNKRKITEIKNNGISLGIHHPWGSWKERWSSTYIKKKIKKLFRFNIF